jgi:tRNA-dihydrouridine synthase
VQQKYIGASKWSALRDIASQYGNIDGFTLGGSGDIWKPADVKRMLDETGVHMVSVARGCIGNPWFFEQAAALLRGDTVAATTPPTIHQQRDVLLEHFELSVGLHGETRASMMMRKFGIRFSRHHPEAESVRERFIRVKSLAEWHATLSDYYLDDGPGRSVESAVPEEATEATCEPMGSET